MMTVNHGTYTTSANQPMKSEFYVCIKYNDCPQGAQAMKTMFIHAKNLKKAIKKVQKRLDINCTFKIKQIA